MENWVHNKSLKGQLIHPTDRGGLEMLKIYLCNKTIRITAWKNLYRSVHRVCKFTPLS